jgi:hypothetical protein
VHLNNASCKLISVKEIVPHENNQTRLTCQQVKAMDMVDFLKASGYEPQKIKGLDYWYLSPLRQEKTASFKVNLKLNRWYDHGIGKGANLVDFAVRYDDCSVKELLMKSFASNQPYKFLTPNQFIRPLCYNTSKAEIFLSSGLGLDVKAI